MVQYRDVELVHYEDSREALTPLKRRSPPSLNPLNEYVGVGRLIIEHTPHLSRRQVLLLAEFRTGHAPESPLWEWLGDWDTVERDFEDTKKQLGEWLSKKLYDHARENDLGFSEFFIPALLQHILVRDMGEGRMLDPRVKPHRSELRQGEYVLATGDANVALAVFLDLREEAYASPETTKLRGAYRRMVDLKGLISDEVDILTMMRAFPGRCKLCPP